MQLIALPRDLGLHPETNKKIVANIGRFGPYVNYDGKFKSIPKTDSVFTINLDRAVELLAQANSGPAPIRVLGSHPSEEGEIAIYSGRYGPYVQHAKIRATIPKSEDPETLTMEEALTLLAAKAAKDAPVKTKKRGRRKQLLKSQQQKLCLRRPAPKKRLLKNQSKNSTLQAIKKAA